MREPREGAVDVRWLFAVAAGVALVVTLGGCAGEEPPEPPAVVRPVKTLVVRRQTLGRLTFPGTTQSAVRAEVSFRVSGPLIELPVKEGDLVKRGQLLARIDPRDYRLAVAEAKAAFEKADADHRRYQRLYERDAVPLADVEFYRAARDISRAKLDKAEADLKDTFLRAPFRGQIGRRLVENFEEVQAQQPVMTLNDTRDIEIVIDVSESVLNRAKSAALPRIVATFSAAPDREYPLTLKEAATQADERTQTFAVTFSMSQPTELMVLPGMTALVIAYGEEAEIEGSGPLTVPSQAVFAGSEGSSQVWTIDQGAKTVHVREVEVGELVGENDIEVLSGLSEGELIAVTAVHHLSEGMEVRPVEEMR